MSKMLPRPSSQKRGRALRFSLLGGGLAIFVGVLVVLSSCVPTTVTELQIVRVVEVAMRDITATTMTLDLTLEIRNAHKFSVTVSELSDRIALTGDWLGEGRLTQSFTLPGNGSANVVLPVVVEFAKVSEADFATLFQPEVPYRVSGTLSISKPIRIKAMTLTASGRVRAANPLRVAIRDMSTLNLVSFKDVRIDEVGLDRSRATLMVDIKNPYSFPLHISQSHYRVESAGQQLGQGSLLNGRAMQPGVNRFAIPIQSRPLDTIAGLVGQVLSGRIAPQPVVLSGTLVVKRGNRTLQIDYSYSQSILLQ